jgi:hypothetical protein
MVVLVEVVVEDVVVRAAPACSLPSRAKASS